MANNSSLLVSSNNSSLQLNKVFEQAYTTNSGGWVARLGFAYASASGLEILQDAAAGTAEWQNTRKQWIVGIDGGITEPAAIKQIGDLPNCEVRIFTKSNHITDTSLKSTPKFHAKVVCINSASRVTCLLAGSANLTWSAMSESPRNYEASLALFDNAITSKAKRTFNRWWSNAWSRSIQATDSMLNDYATLRQSYLRRNPDVKTYLEPPALRQIGAANALWIEAGAMSGGSRNQVEFSREIASYFGPVVMQRRFPPIVYGGQLWTNRPLSYKVTTFGVEIWRFSLPTRNQSGLQYPGRIIRFRKVTRDNLQCFEIDVADMGTRKERRWRSIANRNGYVGVTSGDREFGFY